MRAGYLYIVQYPHATFIKGGRALDAEERLHEYEKGTVLLFTVVTSDMRRAEKAMLESLRSAEAVAEGIEAMKPYGHGDETFSGPFEKIVRRATEAACLFPVEPRNMMGPAAAREWYERAKASGEVSDAISYEQFLIDNECLLALLKAIRRPEPKAAEMTPEEVEIARARQVEEAQEAVAAARALPILTSAEHAAMKARLTAEQTLSQLEKQRVWEYDMAIDLYGLKRTEVDDAFLAEYVGACGLRSTVKIMKKQQQKLCRFGYAYALTPAELRGCCESEAEVPEAKGSEGEFWPPAVAVSELLDMMEPAWRGKVSGDEPIRFTSKAAALALLRLVSSMDDESYTKLLSMLGIKPRRDQSWRTRVKLIKNLRSLDEGSEESGEGASDASDDPSVPRQAPTSGPAEASSTPRGKVKTSSALVRSLLESAFGIKCVVDDGTISLDVEAFTYIRKRRHAPF